MPSGPISTRLAAGSFSMPRNRLRAPNTFPYEKKCCSERWSHCGEPPPAAAAAAASPSDEVDT